MVAGSQRNSNWFTLGDPLRGVAALGVLIFHAAMTGALSSDDQSTLGTAGKVLFHLDAGVFLFFALSGYLIGRPFAAAFIQQKPFPNIPRFVVKRIRRLLPGMVAATALSLVVFGTLGASLKSLAVVVGFGQVYAPSRFSEFAVTHFWTLDAEMVFYVALPLVAFVALKLTKRIRGTQRRALIWIAGSALVVLPSLWFRARGGTGELIHMHVFPSVAFGFAPGLVLAGVEQLAEPATRSRPEVGVRIARILLLTGALALVVYFAAPDGLVIHGVLASLACSLVLAAAVVRSWAGATPWRFLASRPLMWLGERSYSLYLFHVAALYLVSTKVVGEGGNAASRVVLITLLAVPASLVLAWAGYRFVERPFMSPGSRPVSVETPETTGEILIRA